MNLVLKINGTTYDMYSAALHNAIKQLQAELAKANKNYKNARLGAENSIYNLLSHITNNKYGPWSVSRKDDIVPQWFDALEKEVKQLQAELAEAKKRIAELEAERPMRVQGFRRT